MDESTNDPGDKLPRVRRAGVSAAWQWGALAVVLGACLTAGACALWMPDRAPDLLARAEASTSAPVSVEEYDGARQVTVVPSVSASVPLTGNATGTVTAVWADGTLRSGRRAYAVDAAPVVALATQTPPYRDLAVGDRGADALALNGELARLGYDADPDSDAYSARTQAAWSRLMRDNGAEAPSGFRMADVLWIPSAETVAGEWSALTGTPVSAGAQVGVAAGRLASLSIKGGQASDRDRVLTVLSHSVDLPAGTVEVDDARFLAAVAGEEEYRRLDAAALAAGIGASVALKEPTRVLRVPVGALARAGDGACMVPLDGRERGKALRVTIVDSALGASLVRPADGGDPPEMSRAAAGSALEQGPCAGTDGR